MSHDQDERKLSSPRTVYSARYWICTLGYKPNGAGIPEEMCDDDLRSNIGNRPALGDSIDYIEGQLERGKNTGYIHWQFVLHNSTKLSRTRIKSIYGSEIHCEPTRSDAANRYCKKSETGIRGTQFELGRKPLKRCSSRDWETIITFAANGEFSKIPGDVAIRYFQNLTKIRAANSKTRNFERLCVVYYGATGLGKSRRAWFEALLLARGDESQIYRKNARHKYFDGYTGQPIIIIDEFLGVLAIEQLLLLLDRYGYMGEIKGSAISINAKVIFITSNQAPEEWYKGQVNIPPQIYGELWKALKRRLNSVKFLTSWEPGDTINPLIMNIIDDLVKYNLTLTQLIDKEEQMQKEPKLYEIMEQLGLIQI